ncbi:MAG: S8 family serine peptidase, partial [candidate division Zixibacteria bacterium]|nr:S8 family serine peptidase [candidate division Zixibacteria bacterium]
MTRTHNSGKLLLLLVLCSLLFSATGAYATELCRPDQIVVELEPGVAIAPIAQELKLQVLDSIDDDLTYLVSFSKARDLNKVLDSLSLLEGVKVAYGNRLMTIPEVFQVSQGFPDQAMPTFIRGVSPESFYDQTGVYATGIEEAQQLATGNGVVVAVIDNGIDINQPLVKASTVLRGKDFVDYDANPDEEPGTYLGHGTFVSVLILLTAPECTLVPVRAFNGEGIGSQFDIAKAINWAVAQRVDVINMSFGSEGLDLVLERAIDKARRKEIVLVASTGNEGTDLPLYPAASEGVIAVGAIDPQELVADFSSWGPHVDLCAPGVNVYSGLAGEFEWGTWSGTSFAAPFISGTAALVLDATSPGASREMAAHLRASARTDLLWGKPEVPDLHYGYGVLDAHRAVSSVIKGDLNLDNVVDPLDIQ